MKIMLGFKPGVFNALVQVPDLFSVILQYLDCSSLFALTMVNKKLFGLFDESKIDQLAQSSEETLNVVTMDPNLWLNLVSYYEERLRKLKLEFNSNDFYQYYPMNINFKEYIELANPKSTEKSNVKTGNIREILEIIVDCKKNLKKLYLDCWKQRKPEVYGIEVSKSGRSGCKTCFKQIPYGVLRGYQDNHENYYKAHECHHLTCFYKLLLAENVREEDVKYEEEKQKETISKLYELIGKEKKSIQKAKGQCITCDDCNILLNGDAYMSSEKANMDLCVKCFVTNNELLSGKSEKGSFVPTPLKTFQKCRYCKEKINRVLFNCHQCNISFCGECLKSLRWFEHKHHFINVIGNTLDDEMKCLTSDFKPEDAKPLSVTAYERFSALDLIEELLDESKRDAGQLTPAERFTSIPTKKTKLDLSGISLPNIAAKKPTKPTVSNESNQTINPSTITQPKKPESIKPLEAPKKQVQSSLKLAKPQQASPSKTIPPKPSTPQPQTSKKRVLIELSSDDESEDDEIDSKKLESSPKLLKPSKAETKVSSKQTEIIKKPKQEKPKKKDSKEKSKKKKPKKESSDEESDEDVYLVEKLLDRKIVRGKPYYLVKWEGYPSSDNSWEPKSNISPDLVEDFEEELEENKPRVASKTKKRKM